MYKRRASKCFFKLTVLLSSLFMTASLEIAWPRNDSWATIRVESQGNDTNQCWNGSVPCRTIEYAARKENLNRTTIILSREVHVLSSVIRLKSITNFRLIAEYSRQTSSRHENFAVINCTGRNSGLYLDSSNDIVINNTIFQNCGAEFPSTNVDGNKTWNISTALHIRECKNVRLLSVRLTKSFGMGAVFYDVAGEVILKNVSFHENRLVELYNDPGHGSGGGIYVEFLPSCASKRYNNTLDSHSNYVFENCHFINNTAEHKKSAVSASSCSQFISFGRGGGVSYIARGDARNNTLKFINCSFYGNNALWGGGVFAEFDDSAGNNSIIVQGSKFTLNKALLAGGGMRVGINSNRHNGVNTVNLRNTIFMQNNAQVGGGFSQYRPENAGKNIEKITMKICAYHSNTAFRGSAIHVSLTHLHIETCKIENSTHLQTDVLDVQGDGAIFCYSSIIFFYGDNRIKSNYFTALVLQASYAIIHPGVIYFSNNTGLNGGAVGIFAESGITLLSGAIVHFEYNSASKKGGAIYYERSVSTQRPINSTELRVRDCFFSFQRDGTRVDADKSNTSTYFLGNKAYDTSGKNIYATSISMCRRDDEPLSHNSAFKWKVFHYNGDSPSKTVVTSSFRMEIVKAEEWNAYPGLPFSPKLFLYDENSNKVYGNVRVTVLPKRSGSVKLAGSELFLVKDRIPSITLLGSPLDQFSVKLETLEGASLIQNIHGLKLRMCPLGYYFDIALKKCLCISNKLGLVYGVTRCESSSDVYILRGRWGNPRGRGHNFAQHYCPDNYCQNGDKSSELDKRFRPKHQCGEGRNPNSTLCGECKRGLSVHFGNEKCEKCNNSYGTFWLLLFIAVVALFVLFIMLINVDTYSTSLNAFLYSYQIIPLCTLGNKSLDPFIATAIGLINLSGTGDMQIGVCLWENMDDLDKMFLNYILPVSLILWTLVISAISYRFDNQCTFNRRTTFRAFVFISVLAYADFTRITFNILHPAEVENNNVVFIAGHINFFGDKHAPYAAIAFLVLIFIVVLFPIILICSNHIVRQPAFVRLMGIFDTFQEPFRLMPGCSRAFSSFYFINRVILLLIYIYVPHGCLQDTLFAAVCIIIVIMFAYIKPYRSDWMNLYDTILLTNIAVLAAINVGLNGIEEKRLDLQKAAHALSYVPILCLGMKLLVWACKKVQQWGNGDQRQDRRHRHPFPERPQDDYVQFQDQA